MAAVVVKTLIAVQPQLASEYVATLPRDGAAHGVAADAARGKGRRHAVSRSWAST